MMSEGLGDVGGAGEAEKADGEIAQMAMMRGPLRVRTWKRSSSKVVWRIQCGRLSDRGRRFP